VLLEDSSKQDAEISYRETLARKTAFVVEYD
jgi:hypothetical protein